MRRRFVVAVALLVASTALLAWLPAIALSLPLFLLLAAIAGASFLALARQAWRTAPDDAHPDAPPTAEDAPRRAARAIWIVALALRLPALFAPAWLSDDPWRYLWEGAVQRAGHSPYAMAPAHPGLDGLPGLDESLRERVAHREIPAVYPPASQLLFRFGPHGILGWKLLVTVADLGLVALLLRRLERRGLPPARALLYAWHPLVVLEFAASGHVDVVALLCVFLALALLRRPGAREWLGGALVGVAGLVKPQGFVPLIGLAARRRWKPLLGALAAVALLTAPFLVSGGHLLDGLRRYAHDWEFNGLLYPPLVRFAEWLKALLEGLPSALGLWKVREIGYAIVPNQLGRKLGLLLFAALAWWLARRLRDRPQRLAGALLLAFAATTPAVHPWYLAWLVPFLPFVARHAGRAVLLLTVTTLAAHAVKVTSLATGLWEEPPWIALVTWVAPCCVGAFDLWRAGARRPPALLEAAAAPDEPARR